MDGFNDWILLILWIGSIWAARRSLRKGDPLGKASLHAFLGWLYLIYEGMNAMGVPEKKGWKRNLLAFFLGGIAVLSMILMTATLMFVILRKSSEIFREHLQSSKK